MTMSWCEPCGIHGNREAVAFPEVPAPAATCSGTQVLQELPRLDLSASMQESDGSMDCSSRKRLGFLARRSMYFYRILPPGVKKGRKRAREQSKLVQHPCVHRPLPGTPRQSPDRF